MRSLTLVPIYLSAASRLVERLCADLERILATRVERRPSWFDPEAAFEPSRGQYDSSQFLELLLRGEGTGEKVLGVTNVDLFIPVLTYVFGEAQVDGRAAVVSLHRLRNEAYGLAADDGLLAERLTKEAVHEIGHTLGLVHCVNPECVMHSSTYVEEIDLKGETFCRACREEAGLDTRG